MAEPLTLAETDVETDAVRVKVHSAAPHTEFEVGQELIVAPMEWPGTTRIGIEDGLSLRVADGRPLTTVKVVTVCQLSA